MQVLASNRLTYETAAQRLIVSITPSPGEGPPPTHTSLSLSPTGGTRSSPHGYPTSRRGGPAVPG